MDTKDLTDSTIVSVAKRVLPQATHSPLGYVRRYLFGGAARRRDLRRRLRRHLFFGLAKRYTPAVVPEWPEGKFLVSTWDDEVGLKTFREGPYDGEVLDMVVGRITERPPSTGRPCSSAGRTSARRRSP